MKCEKCSETMMVHVGEKTIIMKKNINGIESEIPVDMANEFYCEKCHHRVPFEGLNKEDWHKDVAEEQKLIEVVKSPEVPPSDLATMAANVTAAVEAATTLTETIAQSTERQLESLRKVLLAPSQTLYSNDMLPEGTESEKESVKLRKGEEGFWEYSFPTPDGPLACQFYKSGESSWQVSIPLGQASMSGYGSTPKKAITNLSETLMGWLKGLSESLGED